MLFYVYVIKLKTIIPRKSIIIHIFLHTLGRLAYKVIMEAQKQHLRE